MGVSGGSGPSRASRRPRPFGRAAALAAALATSASPWACSAEDDGGRAAGGGAGVDAAPDAPSDGVNPDTAPVECVAHLEEPTDAAHAAPLAAAAGEARAGRLTAADIPADPSGLLVWSAGDWVLANDRVALVIEATGASDGFDPWGGKPVGIARVRAGALIEPADFGELFPAIGRYIVETRSVGVLESAPAPTLRAVGTLAPLPALDAIAKLVLPTDYAGIDAAIDWVLEPDAEHVDVFVTLRSTRIDALDVPQPLVFFFQASRMPAYAPGPGFEAATAGGKLPFIGFVSDAGTSFAWQNPTTDVQLFLALSGASIYRAEPFVAPGCDSVRVHYGRLHVGGPGLDGLVTAVARTRGEVLRPVTVTVTEPDGSPASDVRVHARTADGRYVTRALARADGTATLHVPEGAAEVLGYRAGSGATVPVTVGASETTAAIGMSSSGAVRVVVTDAGGEPIPARVQILPETPTTALDGDLGEADVPDGRLHVAYPETGDVTLRAPVGRHRVIASRGYEYEVYVGDVDVTESGTTTVNAVVARAFDTPDTLCGDFHVHTHRSVDAPDTAMEKVRAALADGVEIPVRSEHEWVASFEPQIAALGAEAFAYGIASHELTTFEWGHFGVFPLEPDPTRPNAGGIPWTGRLPPDALDDARSRVGVFGNPTIIVNHPRTFGGLMNEGSYFTAAGYDPDTGNVARPELWDDEFRLIEAFNASTFDDNFDETVRDWFSFLDVGRTMFVVGSSDSHVVSMLPVGYPRTCVALGVNTPAALRALGAGVVRDAMLDGHMTVSGGIFLDVRSMTGLGPGERVTGAASVEGLSVTVRAATWVTVDTLRVYRDGRLDRTLAIDATTVDPADLTVRFDQVITVPVATGALGSYVVVVASGAAPLDPVHPGKRPFAVSNPIFFVR